MRHHLKVKPYSMIIVTDLIFIQMSLGVAFQVMGLIKMAIAVVIGEK